jgi:hypothetical protein
VSSGQVLTQSFCFPLSASLTHWRYHLGLNKGLSRAAVAHTHSLTPSQRVSPHPPPDRDKYVTLFQFLKVPRHLNAMKSSQKISPDSKEWISDVSETVSTSTITDRCVTRRRCAYCYLHTPNFVACRCFTRQLRLYAPLLKRFSTRLEALSSERNMNEAHTRCGLHRTQPVQSAWHTHTHTHTQRPLPLPLILQSSARPQVDVPFTSE